MKILSHLYPNVLPYRELMRHTRKHSPPYGVGTCPLAGQCSRLQRKACGHHIIDQHYLCTLHLRTDLKGPLLIITPLLTRAPLLRPLKTTCGLVPTRGGSESSVGNLWRCKTGQVRGLIKATCLQCRRPCGDRHPQRWPHGPWRPQAIPRLTHELPHRSRPLPTQLHLEPLYPTGPWMSIVHHCHRPLPAAGHTTTITTPKKGMAGHVCGGASCRGQPI